MFNVFSYEKQLAQTQNFERMKDRFVKDEINRKKAQDKMSNNYRKRVENFVLQMAEKPVVTHDFVPPVVKIRDEDPSKYLGGPSVVVRSFKHERDRIKENIENYNILRMEHTHTPFEFRKRDASKEIQPMMRFTSKTNFERVANRLKVLMQNPGQDVRALTKSAENFSDSFILELSKSPQATNKYLAKHILPDLNTKTHFKAANSLYLALPDTLMDKRTAQAKAKAEKAEKLLKRVKDGVEQSPIKKGGSAPQTAKAAIPGELDLSEIPNQRGGNIGNKANANEALPPIKNSANRFEEETKDAEKQTQHIVVENVNPVEVSKKVLTKCNQIRTKKEGAHTLMRGSGHLMSMSERSLGDIYRDIYKKPY